MLHILWLIIKFILILLGILLGILVFLLLVLLFVPVRYRLEGSFQKQALRGSARVSWLLGGLSFCAVYGENGLSGDLHIFGLSLKRLKAWRDSRRKGKRTKKKIQKGTGNGHDDRRTPVPVRKNDSGQPSGNPDTQQASQEKKNIPLEEPKQQYLPEAADLSHERKPSKKSIPVFAYFRRAWQMLIAILKKVVGIPGKVWKVLRWLWKLPGRILTTLRKLALTIRKFYDKINYWKDFLQDERTKSALRHLWQECRGLLGQICPRKISGQIVFGLEDPAITGEILAGLGITYPIHKNRIQVVPVFDRKILEGEIQCRGRLYGVTLLRIAWRLYFDRNLRYVWNRWKNKEG